jgi:Spy/CpxP family protein refolding chaperone
MKETRIHRTRSRKAWPVLPVVALLWLPAAFTNAQSNDRSAVQGGQPSMMGQGMMQNQTNEHWKDMQRLREHMQRRMKSNDAELDRLIVTMNQATGTGKVEAIAAVVNQMARQQEEMQREMVEMQSQMMQQLTAGEPTGARSSEGSPMMKGMMGGGRMSNANAVPENQTHK